MLPKQSYLQIKRRWIKEWIEKDMEKESKDYEGCKKEKVDACSGIGVYNKVIGPAKSIYVPLHWNQKLL